VDDIAGLRDDHGRMSRIRIGVSQCLLGDAVRYDGGHEASALVVEVLGSQFDLVPVCPEVEIGLGVPRPPIRLVRIGGEIRVRGVLDTERDVTDALDVVFEMVRDRLEGISGYVFKRGSPSCGMDRVKLVEGPGPPTRAGQGRFARALTECWPELPVVEEWQLDDPEIRDRFTQRVLLRARRSRDS
jgi:uncharacterized protein YbbK (DUF523 family)